MSIFAGKKGHHKKGHYDDEHKGHKGNNCMKLLCKKFPRNKLLVFFHISGKKGHDKHYEHDDHYHKKGGKKGGHKKGYEKKGH